MTFYIYKQRRRGSFRFYPDNWILAGTRETEPGAVALAESLCPKGRDIYTEPGRGLRKAFFGPVGTSGWSSMIETKNIHKKDNAR